MDLHEFLGMGPSGWDEIQISLVESIDPMFFVICYMEVSINEGTYLKMDSL